MVAVTEDDSSVAPVLVIVNVINCVPALPSASATSPIENAGSASSLTIVPTPCPSATFAPLTLVTLTKKASLSS